MIVVSALALLAGGPALAKHPDQDVDAPMQTGAADHADHCGLPMGEGVIETLDVAKSKVRIAHKPIAEIGWKAMTMEFGVLKPVDLAAFAAGDKVHFLLARQKDKSYRVAAMCALDAEDGAHKACMNAMHETAAKLAAAAGKPCMTDMKGMRHKGHSELDGALLLASHRGDADEDRCKDPEHKNMDHDGDGEPECKNEDETGDGGGSGDKSEPRRA
jgi:Cu/Ag efflux protein CusF